MTDTEWEVPSPVLPTGMRSLEIRHLPKGASTPELLPDLDPAQYENQRLRSSNRLKPRCLGFSGIVLEVLRQRFFVA
ncbi:MAG: hypothetical protein OXF56_13015, partial [Rhodobacteraceae bacterium]|nr:hypothetical protein [Paracoccaceae bacterium]